MKNGSLLWKCIRIEIILYSDLNYIYKKLLIKNIKNIFFFRNDFVVKNILLIL